MKSQVEELVPGLVRVSKENTDYLGFKISNNTKPDPQAVGKQKNKVPGYIISNGEINPWVSEGAIEYNGRYLIGKFFEGKTLGECISLETEELVPYLSALIDSFEALDEKTGDVPRLQTNAVIFDKNMRVLSLTNDILQRLRATQHETERLEIFDKFNDHTKNNKDNLSFSLATILYSKLCGVYPFKGDSVGAIQHSIRVGKRIPPKLINPSVKTDISDMLHNALAEKTYTYEEWRQLLSRIANKQWKEELGEEAENRLIEQGKKLAARYEKTRKIETFFRKYQTLLLVSSAIAVFIIAIAYSILSNVFAPPVTAGMEPEEVVELLYDSINSFDHMAIEDTMAKHVGDGLINEATHMYVIAKMRQGYEQGGSAYLDVQEWVDAGRPPVPVNKTIYGIANLDIKAIDEDSFTVSYEKWTPRSSDEIENPGPPKFDGYMIVEDLELEKGKKAWQIVSITRVSEEKIDY